MTLEELLQKLKELKRPSELFGKIEYFPVINNEGFKDVELIIRQYALDNHDAEIGVLKAKVYAYERIIANSNFAPIIEPKKEAYNKGYADGQRALSEHIKLCQEEQEPKPKMVEPQENEE